MSVEELINLDIRDEEMWALEAKKRELRRELALIRSVRFGTLATTECYEARVQQIQFEIKKYEEEY